MVKTFVMNKDYQLGKAFSEWTCKFRPDNQQKLLAAFGDFAASDHDLISAFRLLFGNPLYVSAFLSQQSIGPPQFSSLASIARSSLSAPLARRAEVFICGYFGMVVDELFSEQTSSTTSDPSQSGGEASFSLSPRSRFLHASTGSEESTVFAEDPLVDQRIGSHSAQGMRSTDTPSLIKLGNTKHLLYVIGLILLGISSFKVSVLCEPFGLCEKKVDSGVKDIKRPRTSIAGKESTQNNLESPDPPRIHSESLARPRASVNEVVRAPLESPQPAYTPPPPPPRSDNAPLRDEPLW